MDQPKLERLLRLMKLLTANSYLTVENIAEKLGITTRSVYRYIDTFREAGFVIACCMHHLCRQIVSIEN